MLFMTGCSSKDEGMQMNIYYINADNTKSFDLLSSFILNITIIDIINSNIVITINIVFL